MTTLEMDDDGWLSTLEDPGDGFDLVSVPCGHVESPLWRVVDTERLEDLAADLLKEWDDRVAFGIGCRAACDDAYLSAKGR